MDYDMSGQVSVEEESMHHPIHSKHPIKFDWETRWLKGYQYAFILQNVDRYCQGLNIQKFNNKTHPLDIYQQPVSTFLFKVDGMLYFVEGNNLGCDFGFPRIEGKKKYRWKKMNFTTDLPKKNPKVTYIVASTTHNSKINENEHKIFRMHAVLPYHR